MHISIYHAHSRTFTDPGNFVAHWVADRQTTGIMKPGFHFQNVQGQVISWCLRGGEGRLLINRLRGEQERKDGKDRGDEEGMSLNEGS